MPALRARAFDQGRAGGHGWQRLPWQSLLAWDDTRPTPIELDAYVVDVLMPDLIGHDRAPSAFVVYLCLWARTRGGRGPTGELSLTDLAEATGLSKRSVQDALARLERRQLVAASRLGPTSGRSFSVLKPWLRGRRPR